jgi:hypothetical protein
VWALLEQEQHDAASPVEERRPAESATIEQALPRAVPPQSVRRLPAERVAVRLSRLAEDLPEPALFQFLLHFHLAERRLLLVEPSTRSSYRTTGARPAG